MGTPACCAKLRLAKIESVVQSSMSTTRPFLARRMSRRVGAFCSLKPSSSASSLSGGESRGAADLAARVDSAARTISTYAARRESRLPEKQRAENGRAGLAPIRRDGNGLIAAKQNHPSQSVDRQVPPCQRQDLASKVARKDFIVGGLCRSAHCNPEAAL